MKAENHNLFQANESKSLRSYLEIISYQRVWIDLQSLSKLLNHEN